MSVRAIHEVMGIPTYPVGAPERNPVFFEKRVYQGSDGKVYPVPFVDKVGDVAGMVDYRAVRLENALVRLVVLPEIGGRIFRAQDLLNGGHDFFYRQEVIKPALVGLAGPWISGGVEFNWPQHHRPGTFLPADVTIEEEPGGARTVWLSEHDPLNRLKGMHGIRLRPDSSLIEVRVRLYNRTPLTHTFLWWANVAAMVHEDYQSFFPPDVDHVADHAVRAMSSFPVAINRYYGIDYAARPGANDLGWYRNIPVPTSYMVCRTGFDFFGGYDFRAGGGFVHVANRHIAPGKKQWTWGDHPFGHAWDRELTDANGPYIELMAGVYTDNQPDFTYLMPYETKTFSQYWWPLQGIGPVQQANARAALRLVVGADRAIELAVSVPEAIEGARIVLARGGEVLSDDVVTLRPGPPWRREGLVFDGESPAELSVSIDAAGSRVLAYRPVVSGGAPWREVASEPPPPEELQSADELYFTGEHLELYRHPTRSPELYWQEALVRDPGDVRCHIGMGRRALRQGRLDAAAGHFRAAVARLTRRHPNPETGEAHYFLGVTLAFLGDIDAAYGFLYKATWNQAWKSAAFYRIACIDCRGRDWQAALEHLREAVAAHAGNSSAQVLQVAVLRKLGQAVAARELLDSVLKADPLDHRARFEEVKAGMLEKEAFLAICRNDGQTILDLAFDYEEAGLVDEAECLLEWHLAAPVVPVSVPNPLGRTPMTMYVLAWLRRDPECLARARQQSPDHAFPSRQHERMVLEWALAQPGADPLAAYALGNTYYDQRRHEDAIRVWQRAVDSGASFATVHRNLGIALWNVRRDGNGARNCYLKALELDPADPRLVSEFDQLRMKLNEVPEARLAFLEDRRALVMQRDDCTVALAALYNLTGKSREALDLLTSRRFHPWEGGEGSVLRQFASAHLALGREALGAGDAEAALAHFHAAADPPASLGEVYHPLQAMADVQYWTGCALRALGREDEARECFVQAAADAGDFAEMAVTAHSPQSYHRGLALQELGRNDEARALFQSLMAFGEAGLQSVAKIDYFATSLPNLLVFDEDLQARRDAEHHLLIALACAGLGAWDDARRGVEKVLSFNRADPHAVDLFATLESNVKS